MNYSWFFRNCIQKPVVFVLTLLLLTCCTDTIGLSVPDNSIHFSNDIGIPSSRTNMNGSNASFTANDQIGVFETLTNRDNVLYTYDTPNWTTTTPMYWRNNISLHKFYAYYPYNSSSTGQAVAVPALSGQTISSSPDARYDLLTASLNTTHTASVNFNFNHALTLLKFNVSFATSLLSTLASSKITITGGNSTTSTYPSGLFNTTASLSNLSYNLINQQLVIANNTSSTFQQSFTATLPTLVSGATTIYVLVLPGTYTNPAPYVKFSVKLISLIELSTSSPSLNTTTFQPNTVYEYNVQVIPKLLSRANSPADSIEIFITPVKEFSGTHTIQ